MIFVFLAGSWRSDTLESREVRRGAKKTKGKRSGGVPLSRGWGSPGPSLIPFKHVFPSRRFRLSERLEQAYIIPKQVVVVMISRLFVARSAAARPR